MVNCGNTMIRKPSFILSKSERKQGVYYDPHTRYVNIAAGIYDWYNLPETVPVGYIERAIYWYGAVGAKYSQSMDEVIVVPAVAGLRNIYGEPLTWTPTGIYGNHGDNEILQPSDTPVLYRGVSIAEEVDKYIEIIRSSYNALQQNIMGLSQPIALSGRPGNNAEGLMYRMDLISGEMFLPVIDAGNIRMEVIDLKASDYTQQLIATANAMDNEILTVLGVNNTGTQKDSGITSEESTSIHQELQLTSGAGLKWRRRWCDKINNVLGTNFEVEISDDYEVDDLMGGVWDETDIL